MELVETSGTNATAAHNHIAWHCDGQVCRAEIVFVFYTNAIWCCLYDGNADATARNHALDVNSLAL